MTDWLHNVDALRLMPLLVPLLCALALAATRQRLPPQNSRWRLVRAFFMVGCYVAVWMPVLLAPGERGMGIYTLPFFLEPRLVISTISLVVGLGVFMAWLVPTVIEGRSLREMGWNWQRPGMRLVVPLAAGVLLGLLMSAGRPRSAPDDVMLQELGLDAGYGVTPMLLTMAALWAFVIAALSEENLFRGHLLPSLQEVGLSGRAANVVQALAFVCIHIPGLVATIVSPTSSLCRPVPPAFALLGWFGWGILFGWLRLRTGSILPGFAWHGGHNFVRFVAAYARAAAMVRSLG